MCDEIENSKQWIAKANSDLLNADNNLQAENIPFDTVCFHCQQAAEKFLKAYLVAKGHPYPISHDLLLILEKILSFEPSAEILRDDLALLMPYSVEIRYPDDWFMPTAEDAIEAKESAMRVMTWLQNVLPEILIDPSSHRGSKEGK